MAAKPCDLSTFWAQTWKTNGCRWCMPNFTSIGLQLYEEKIFKCFSLFFEKSKWPPNHVTCQDFELKYKRAMDVDGVWQISCQSVCNFMRRRFLKVLASFSNNQNGGLTTWLVKFLSSNQKDLCMYMMYAKYQVNRSVTLWEEDFWRF